MTQPLLRYPHAVVGTTQSLNEKSELIKTEGERGKMVYMLGEKYKKQNDIIAKALNIGLKALEENGEL